MTFPNKVVERLIKEVYQHGTTPNGDVSPRPAQEAMVLRMVKRDVRATLAALRPEDVEVAT
ncbi:hypothetical protein LCGC14_0320030 [marine sediment metagenome]|uniref:Uncharacterized protein n=1 Tax=marine sediment metagenome TaxID=412755 RepID=A0A0F9TJL0_9ZZZZ